MKKYTFTYKGKDYVENIYNFKSTTILSELLPFISEEDVSELIGTSLNIKNISDANYSKNIKITNVGNQHVMYINFSNKTKLYTLRKIVLDKKISKIFNLKSVNLTSEELKVWYPQSEVTLKQFNEWIQEFNLNQKNINLNENSERLNSQKVLQDKYPLENIKNLTYDEFVEMVKFLEFDKSISHPSTRNGSLNKWGFYKSMDGIVRSGGRKLIESNFEEFKEELFDILSNYKEYDYWNNDEFSNKFKYITSNVFGLYLRSYIYVNDPSFESIFISKGALDKLGNFLYANENSNKFNILDLGEKKYVLKYFLQTHGVSKSNITNLLWWIISSKIDKYWEVLETSNLENEDINSIVENTENEIEEYISFLDVKVRTNFIDQLQKYKNVIIEGVPGIGKTYNIKHILQSEGYKVTNIQFHKSYSYEEFVQGYKPSLNGQFELKNGIILDLINSAINDSDNNYALIIDEINRGDIMGIFGELFTLIEKSKRDEYWKMKLQYSQKEVYLPPNLYIIGTMNNLDLSLNDLDFALQRRFKFIRWEPNFTLLKDYLIDTFDISSEIINSIISSFEKLNQDIKSEFSNEHILGVSYISDLFPDENASNEEIMTDLDLIESYNDLLQTNISKLIKSYSYGEETNINIKEYLVG